MNKRITKEELQEYFNKHREPEDAFDGVCQAIEADLLNVLSDLNEEDQELMYDIVHGNLFEYDPFNFED